MDQKMGIFCLNSKYSVRNQFTFSTAYASPFRHRMDKKSSKNTLSYPNLYFLIDDFDSAWDQATLLPDQEFCVELVAQIDPKFFYIFPPKSGDLSSEPAASASQMSSEQNQTSVFLGASAYSVISEGTSFPSEHFAKLNQYFEAAFLQCFGRDNQMAIS